MSTCSGYVRPTKARDPTDPIKARYEIDGTCVHGFPVTPPCYSERAAKSKAPICCNEDWSARFIGSWLDDSGKPKKVK